MACRKLLYRVEVCRVAAITGASECKQDGFGRMAADLDKTARRLTRVRNYLLQRQQRGN